MKKVFLSALATFAVSSFVLPSLSFAQVVPATQSQVSLDPNRPLGSVTVENGKTSEIDLRLPSALIGPFDTTLLLPATWRGAYPAYDIGAITKVVEVRGPTGVTVELLRAHVAPRARSEDRGDNQQSLLARLRVGVNNSDFSASRRISLQITLENAQSKNRMSFVLEVNSR